MVSNTQRTLQALIYFKATFAIETEISQYDGGCVENKLSQNEILSHYVLQI